MEKRTASKNDGETLLSWDDICVNPHETFLQQGRQEGREAGLAQGYHDGYRLGRTKALEFGVELGFIRGFVRTMISSKQYTNLSERVQTNLQELKEMTHEFPSPEAMFAATRSSSSDRTGDVDVPSSTKNDVLQNMQRIRAKFKLLAVQLKMPYFSLKQVMKDAADVAAKEEKQEQTSDKQQETTTERSGKSSSDW